MARENPTWGRRRIQAELALLGYTVAELTVAKYMQRTSPRPSPTWRAFLATLRRYYGPVLHPLVFDRLPGLAGYTVYLAPIISYRDE